MEHIFGHACAHSKDLESYSNSALATALCTYSLDIIPTLGFHGRVALRSAAASLAFGPAVVFARPGHDVASLPSGFLHPLGGADHIIALVAVGLLAARRGQAVWLVPASFVATMAVACRAGNTMGLVAFFAVFHRYAYGAEMPETRSDLAYGAGFAAATALLHGVGIALGLIIGQFGRSNVRPLA
jgi:urease accessory protein